MINLNTQIYARTLYGLIAFLILTPAVYAITAEPGYVRSHNSIRMALSNGANVDNLGYEQNQSYNFSKQKRPLTSLQSMQYHPGIESTAWQHAQACELTHSNTANGENVFAGLGNEWTIQSAIQSWALEVENYDLDEGCATGQRCEHYTQLVWSQSTQLGCAIASCDSIQDHNGDPLWGGEPATMVVCQYAERGNTSGEKPYIAETVEAKKPNALVMNMIIGLLLE